MDIVTETKVSLDANKIAKLFSDAGCDEQAEIIDIIVNNFNSWGDFRAKIQLEYLADGLKRNKNFEHIKKFLHDFMYYIEN